LAKPCNLFPPHRSLTWYMRLSELAMASIIGRIPCRARIALPASNGPCNKTRHYNHVHVCMHLYTRFKNTLFNCIAVQRCFYNSHYQYKYIHIFKSKLRVLARIKFKRPKKYVATTMTCRQAFSFNKREALYCYAFLHALKRYMHKT
jgi:hypothetical protein